MRKWIFYLSSRLTQNGGRRKNEITKHKLEIFDFIRGTQDEPKLSKVKQNSF